ncbi:MAG: flagellar hook-associated protein FlgK [Pseudomonadota bacterium]
MPVAIINIGRSGAAAARASLELTAQNIANASNPDYARRALSQSEFVGSATIGVNSADSLGGVRIGGVSRSESELVQIQARNAGSDLARTEAQLVGMRGAETALEQSRLFETLVEFEAALVRLESDPTDPTLRTVTLESARQLANTFQLADRSLSETRRLVQADVTAELESFQVELDELARINRDLVAAREGSAGRASLLDQRDASLRSISEQFGVSVTFAETGAAEVRLTGTPSPVLVSGGTSSAISAAFAADGTVTFAVDGQPADPTSGAMVGRAAALLDQAGLQTELDDIAAVVISSSNSAQASGSELDGSPGQPLFAGSSAGTITLALTAGEQLATAPAGAPAGSRDTTTLGNLINAIGASTGPIAGADTMLLGLSSRTAGLETRREGLEIVAQAAEGQLLAETGVNLDDEAANLVRLQQAFEANGRVIQVAVDIFDTVLNLR